ncbi:hypothetical protein AAT19DRAFT_11405 [Rhodotorula toruloides]|uniref:Uncharacterized protein n=1 Tax=Rhodotorula toruloides TaxID=5286 RepID=A0A2S9ZWR5_RHOTO|nr:hypothetical protein AAT19DRAFT_11405 [Rhodotorula toruloides]
MRLTARLSPTKATRRQLSSSLVLRRFTPPYSSPHAADSMIPSPKDVNHDAREHAGMREPLCPTRRDTPNMSHAMGAFRSSRFGVLPAQPLSRCLYKLRNAADLLSFAEDVTVSHHGHRPSVPQTDLPFSRDFTSGSLSIGERYEPTHAHPKPHPSPSHPSLVDRFEGEAEELVGRWRHDAQLVEAGRAQRYYGGEAIKQGMRNGGGSVMC